MTDPILQKTMFAVDVADPRQRAAGVALEAPRPPAKMEGGARTSDLWRPRALLMSGGLAALFSLGAALARPSTTVPLGPGPLTPPHQAKGLTCVNCHQNAKADEPAFRDNAKKACVGCHGPHPSTRSPHRAKTEKGEMTCATCHQIHGSQQGVRFGESEGETYRYGTAATVPIGTPFTADRNLLVPIIPSRACKQCHTGAPGDPFERCVSQKLAGELGDDAPALCFDEHQSALPPDVDPKKRRADTPDGVCREQHFADRPYAWEAARLAAHEVPFLRPGSGSGGGGGNTPVYAGIGGAVLGLALSRGLESVRRRREKQKVAAPAPATVKRLPLINTTTCLGCYACVDACPYGVLEVDRYVAVVARPDACCGLVLCEQKCPNGSLTIREGEAVDDRPRLTPELESIDIPGLYLAGDLTGLPLIKNAILQGAQAAEHAHRSLQKSPTAAKDVYDILVVGAGPAGISAALASKRLGAKTLVLEQDSVAASIRSFPRGKLVFDQPLDLPLTGKLWLEQCSKEELLSHWTRIVRTERLPIQEGTRMIGLSRGPRGELEVQAVRRDGVAETLSARRVIVAIGRRGTPRKLAVPVPEEVESRIFYSLADARSLAGQRVVVLGLGDSAMEAAAALCHTSPVLSTRTVLPGQPIPSQTSVTILHRGATYSRGQPRNIEEVERLRKAGRLSVLFDADVEAVSASELTVRVGKEPRRIPFDVVLVLIGTIPPRDTLAKLGIKMGSGLATAFAAPEGNHVDIRP